MNSFKDARSLAELIAEESSGLSGAAHKKVVSACYEIIDLCNEAIHVLGCQSDSMAADLLQRRYDSLLRESFQNMHDKRNSKAAQKQWWKLYVKVLAGTKTPVEMLGELASKGIHPEESDFYKEIKKWEKK